MTYIDRMTKRTYGGIPLFLMLFLIGCGQTPIEYVDRLVEKEVPVFRAPPIDWTLLQPTDRPELRGNRNSDLLDAYIKRGAAIGQCNADKLAIAESLKAE